MLYVRHIESLWNPVLNVFYKLVLLLVIAFIYLVAPKGAVCRFVCLFINIYFSVGPLRWKQSLSKLFADLSLASNSSHRLKSLPADRGTCGAVFSSISSQTPGGSGWLSA